MTTNHRLAVIDFVDAWISPATCASNAIMKPILAEKVNGKLSFRHLFPALHSILLAECDPQGLARGISLGIVLGLMPKGNLLAVALVVTMFIWRCNLLAGMAACLAISLFAYHLDPILDAIGAAFLTIGPLQGIFRGLFAIPWVPWTGLDNTVVAGSLIVGLLQFYPMQRLLRQFFASRFAESHRTERFVQRVV